MNLVYIDIMWYLGWGYDCVIVFLDCFHVCTFAFFFFQYNTWESHGKFVLFFSFKPLCYEFLLTLLSERYVINSVQPCNRDVQLVVLGTESTTPYVQ